MASQVERLEAAKPTSDALNPSGVVLKAIRREALAGAMRVTLELEGEAAFHDEESRRTASCRHRSPEHASLEMLKETTQAFPDDVVRQIRVGPQVGTRTRVVLDLSARAPHTLYALYNPYRVVVDFARDLGSTTDTKTVSAGTKETKAASANPKDGKTSLAVGKGTTHAKAVKPPTVNGRGKFSLSRQLGLGVARIVIDPGHGGYDPGAMNDGVSEADAGTRYRDAARKSCCCSSRVSRSS